MRRIGPYVASKHGIVGLTKTAALDYAQRNIRVNVLAPGPIFTHHFENLTDQQCERIAARVPLGRLGRPAEIADTVVWLCSDAACFVTGTVSLIDGGQLAGPSA